MTTIKPIETVYNGYRFRSRLEARWAVFFDALGIKYEYEKEGYDLDGTWYLPDFWLPEQRHWIEIKGQEPNEEERQKADKLAHYSFRDVHFFYGDIEIPSWGNFYKNTLSYIWLDLNDQLAYYGLQESERGWAQCPWCFQLDITYHSRIVDLPCHCYKYIQPFMYNNQPRRQLLKHCPDLATKEPSTQNTRFPDIKHLDIDRWWADKCHALTYAGDTPRLIKAYTAARQARFEHGESGGR